MSIVDLADGAGSSTDVLTAGLWAVVIGATFVSMGFTFRAFLDAKEVIDRRQDKEKQKQQDEEEKKRKLKEMFDRL